MSSRSRVAFLLPQDVSQQPAQCADVTAEAVFPSQGTTLP